MPPRRRIDAAYSFSSLMARAHAWRDDDAARDEHASETDPPIEHDDTIEPRLRALWLWHSAEEAEHKCTAFDLYQKLSGHHGWRVRIYRYITVVFLADLATDVHLLNLNNAGLSISGKNVLAFSSSLDWNIERVKGGSIAAGGLFNTTLRGTLKRPSCAWHSPSNSASLSACHSGAFHAPFVS